MCVYASVAHITAGIGHSTNTIRFVAGIEYFLIEDDGRVAQGYPRSMAIWLGLPYGGIDAAINYGGNTRTYFFSGPNYYRFNDRLFQVWYHRLHITTLPTQRIIHVNVYAILSFILYVSPILVLPRPNVEFFISTLFALCLYVTSKHIKYLLVELTFKAKILVVHTLPNQRGNSSTVSTSSLELSIRVRFNGNKYVVSNGEATPVSLPRQGRNWHSLDDWGLGII